MSRSPAKSGKATATKSSKEKWLIKVQSEGEKGENETGGSSTITISGSAMGPADALSRLADPDISSDNNNVTLLSDDLFIHVIDTALVDKITSSTPTDPLVLTALQNLSVGTPLFPHSSFTNWHFSNSCLYFKNHLYIPPNARHDLVASVAHALPAHGTLFPFSLRTALCRVSPNHLRCAVQARLCHKRCRHVIGLGPYHLSMTSYPSP